MNMTFRTGQFTKLLPFIYGLISSWLLLGGLTLTLVLGLIKNRFNPFLMMGIGCLIVGSILHYTVYKTIGSIKYTALITSGSGMILFGVLILFLILIIEYMSFFLLCVIIFLLITGPLILYNSYITYRVNYPKN